MEDANIFQKIFYKLIYEIVIIFWSVQFICRIDLQLINFFPHAFHFIFNILKIISLYLIFYTFHYIRACVYLPLFSFHLFQTILQWVSSIFVTTYNIFSSPSNFVATVNQIYKIYCSVYEFKVEGFLKTLFVSLHHFI